MFRFFWTISVSATLFCGYEYRKHEFAIISKLLQEKQKDRIGKLKGYTFHQIRMKLARELPNSFINKKIDTLFLLEKFSIEDGAYYGRIWNMHDSLSFKYSKNKFVLSKSDFFTKYTKYLVVKWDTIDIRLQEQRYTITNPVRAVYASLIIDHADSIMIKTIKFNEFLNLNSDEFDFEN